MNPGRWGTVAMLFALGCGSAEGRADGGGEDALPVRVPVEMEFTIQRPEAPDARLAARGLGQCWRHADAAAGKPELEVQFDSETGEVRALNLKVERERGGVRLGRLRLEGVTEFWLVPEAPGAVLGVVATPGAPGMELRVEASWAGGALRGRVRCHQLSTHIE